MSKRPTIPVINALGDRFRKARKAAGLSLRGASDQTRGPGKTTYQNISAIERGENEKPNGFLVRQLAQIYGCTVEYLMLGVGPDKAPTNGKGSPHVQPVSNWYTVPLVGVDYFARGNMKTAESHTLMAAPLPPDAPTDSLYAMSVEGDAMLNDTNPERSFPAGSFIYFDPSVIEVSPGDFVIARLDDGQIAFRELRMGTGKHYLRPLNRDFESHFGDFEILAKVVYHAVFRQV